MEIDKETLIYLVKYAKIEGEDSLLQTDMLVKKAQIQKIHHYTMFDCSKYIEYSFSSIPASVCALKILRFPSLPL